MKRKTLYALLGSVLLTATAFGQAKLAVSATISPVYTHTSYARQYLYPDSDGQVVEPVYLDGARGATGYSAGVTLRYTYAPGWSVGTGLWYHQTAVRQGRPALAGNGTTTLRSRIVRVPLLLNFQSATNRLSPYYTLGVLLDFPMASRVVVTRTDESTQRLRLVTDGGPVFGVLLGAGASYRLTNRYSLITQPTFTYNLGRLGGRYTNVRRIEMGLLTQLTYSF